MNNCENKYEMNLDLNVLNHLGLNLYSNVSAVLSEVIANAWDADATKVNIKVDKENDTITIEDNGCGMSLDDVNKKFLRVGYQKRKNNCTTTSILKRKVMGRKGIGKLSLLSIAEKIKIYTKKKNEPEESFELSQSEIKRQISNGDKMVTPKAIPNQNFCSENGTKIVLTQLQKGRIDQSINALKKRIARRFLIIDNNFCVQINDEKITLEDRDYFGKLQFFWEIGDSKTTKSIEALNRKEKFQITIPYNNQEHQINGWIGTANKPSDIKDNNKISIVVRGKVAQEDILKEFEEGGIYASYLIGEIEANFLDLDDLDDIATSNRQNFFEYDERYKLLRTEIRKILKTIQSQWSEARKEGATSAALEENDALKEWYSDLTPKHQKYAKKIISTIKTLHFDEKDINTQRNLYKYGIIAFEKLRLQENLKLLDNTDKIHEIISSYKDVFDEIQDIEASFFWEIANERIKIIQSLNKMCDENNKEAILQKHIFDNLWLINPSWERPIQGTQRIEESVTREFKKITDQLSEEEKRGRIDIRYKTITGKHVIIELKRYKASYKIDIYSLMRQVSKYKEALTKCLINSGTPNPVVESICLIGNDALGGQTLEEANAKLKVENSRVILYDTLIREAEESYSQYLSKHKEIEKLHAIIEKI